MAVRLLLEKDGHEIVGEAETGVAIVSLTNKLAPDLVILDMDLPQLDGFAVLQRLCGNDATCKVVVFTGLQTDRYAVRCSMAGASGFVSKESALEELSHAVQIVLAGYTLFPVASFSSVNDASKHSSEEALVRSLSDRELTVLRNLARGYRIKDIARELILSEKTASTYKARLILKLRLNNFVELVEFAKRNGLA